MARARLLDLTRRLWAYDSRSVAEELTLALLLGAVQGFGIVMLVPLLAYVGVPDAAGSGSVSTVATFFFEDLGLPRSLPVILSLYVALVAAQEAVALRSARLSTRLQLGFVRQLRSDLHSAVLAAQWSFVVATRGSDLTQALTHDVKRVGGVVLSLLRGAVGVVMLFVYLVLALALSVSATLLTCSVALGLAWLLRNRLRSARVSGERLSGRANRLYAIVGQHLSGMKEIKAYGAEVESVQRFDSTTTRFDEVQMRFVRDRSGAMFWMTVGGAVSLALILLAAVEGLRVPLASLLLLMYVFARMLPQAGRLQEIALLISNGLPAFESVDALLAAARAAAESRGSEPGPTLAREIALEQVSFAHQPGRPILSGLDLRIPARQTTAIVGRSGAGKSTVALVLMGILTPDDGRISVDGTPLGPGMLRAWRSSIGFVPQETFLFHDTVRANVSWARPDASDDEIREALRRAGAGDFVERLPDGLATVVGDGGVRLSGGERQRVALARALLGRPEVLILDEATSSVDVESERRIFDALSRLHGRLTIVVITHRLASLDNVDRVVVMEEGRVVESGSRGALLTRDGGLFSEMVRLHEPLDGVASPSVLEENVHDV